jgi:PAS domain S-box-containing protein
MTTTRIPDDGPASLPGTRPLPGSVPVAAQDGIDRPAEIRPEKPAERPADAPVAVGPPTPAVVSAMPVEDGPNPAHPAPPLPGRPPGWPDRVSSSRPATPMPGSLPAVPERPIGSASDLLPALGGDTAEGPNVPRAADKAMVLLVDDRRDKLLALQSVLEGLSDELVLARSGKEALRQVLNHEFAVILLDVSMPIMDGFETAALIRKRKSSEHTPIIFITAMSVADTHATRGYSLGAVDYIFAPVLPDVLRAKVSVFIDLFRKARDIRRQADWLRVEAERRAATLESRLDGLLNRLNVGVFRSTIGGDLLSANPSFFRIFGLSPAVDLSTVNLANLYLEGEDRSRLLNRLEAEGRVQEYHVRQRRVDGTIIWVSLSKALSIDADGWRCIDGLVEDVTVRKEAEAAIIAKSEELARSNAELEEFAYVASHDLQEPLRMVSSFSTLIAERYREQVDSQGRIFLDQIVKGAERMRTLIRDILAYSRLGKPAAPVLVDCDELLDKVLFNLQARIEESGAEIRRNPLPAVPGDAVLLGQIFQNLLGNALKFRSHDVRPVISIGARRQGAFWEFVVADNGIGIDPQYHERIFRVFQRLHSNDEYSGTGIGLAICRKAVHHHGGEITLESRPGCGATFRFTLPCVANVPGDATVAS